MDTIVNFVADKISGGYYALLVTLCLFFIFACIGYLTTDSIAKNSTKKSTPQTNSQTSAVNIAQTSTQNVAQK